MAKQELTLGQKLSLIQFEFKANKGQYNSFAKYNFRSAEDILEALKPFNKKYDVYFTINESLINANPPIMQSIATIWDCETSNSIDCQSIVAIDLDQKGMAMPQRYGSASSYGKKYALGNLLLIDDTKDSDATNTHGNEPKKKLIEKPILSNGTELFRKAIDYLAGGGDMHIIETKYQFSEDVRKVLTETKIIN